MRRVERGDDGERRGGAVTANGDRYALELADDGRLTVALRGALDRAAIAAVEAALDRAGYLGPHTEVVVDLRQVQGCALEARDALVRLHARLSQGGRRSAYVARTPLLRGMALWVMHTAGDGRARAVGTEAQAQAWLSRDADRTRDSVYALQLLGARLRRRGERGG